MSWEHQWQLYAESLLGKLEGIARGGIDGPGGLEAVAMAIGLRSDDGPSLMSAVSDVASALERIAAAIEDRTEREYP